MKCKIISARYKFYSFFQLGPFNSVKGMWDGAIICKTAHGANVQRHQIFSGMRPDQGTGSILLIDDDPEFLLVHERMLGSAGHQVLKAETGYEGLQLLQKNPVDIYLPDANGLDLCRHLKNDAAMSECLVFLVSAVQARFDERIQGVKAGAEGYLLKPLQKEELLLRMESALRVKRTQDMLRFERSQLLSIFDSIDESIYVVDPETHEILFANETMKKLFGEELVGETCYLKCAHYR